MDGMVRLGGRDRASWVWFLRNGANGGPTNNGLGVDRENLGYWTIRAWRHSGSPVSSVELHAAEPTADLIEQAARLVGIPLREQGGTCRACALAGLPPCYQSGCAAPEKDEVGDMSRKDLVRRLGAYKAAVKAIESALRVEGETEYRENGAVPTWRMGLARVSGSVTQDRVEVTDPKIFMSYLAGAFPTEVQTVTVQVVRNPEWLTQLKDALARISRDDYDETPAEERTVQSRVIDVHGAVVPGAVFVPGGDYITTSTTFTATAKRVAADAAMKGALTGDWSDLEALVRGEVPME